MESMYITLSTNKSHSINILDLSGLDISKISCLAITEKIEEMSNFLRQHKWTLTFIDKWDLHNYYVILRNRNGISFENYKEKLLYDLNEIVPGNIISRKCILPTLIEIDQLKKMPQNGECMADVTISVRVTRNKI